MCACVCVQSDADYFKVDLPNSGTVMLVKPLDYETKTQLNVTIHATVPSPHLLNSRAVSRRGRRRPCGLHCVWVCCAAGDEHAGAVHDQHHAHHRRHRRRRPVPTVPALHATLPGPIESHLRQPCVLCQRHRRRTGPPYFLLLFFVINGLIYFT